MIRRLALLFALLACLPLFAEETQRYLIATRGRPATSRIRVLANAGLSAEHRVRTFRNVDAFAADLTASEVAELRRSEGVEFVTPVVERYADEFAVRSSRFAGAKQPFVVGLAGLAPANRELPTADSVETELESSWGVSAVHAPAVWNVTRGENINVAVLDTGIDITHPDLRAAYAGGYNTLKPDKPPQDDNKHGTHVSGIIGARGNAFGVIGVAPMVKLWAVKVLDQQGTGTDETVAAGIDWVVEQAKAGGSWIINLSLGSNSPSAIERRAVERALSQDIVVVAAAGNRTPWIRYPARYPGVIAVGAVDQDQKRASFSSYGYGISIMAPGVAVYSTMPQGTIRRADVREPNGTVPAFGLLGSPLGTVTGVLRPAGLGRPEDMPSDIKGKIALIQRGEIPFRDKAYNAKEAGAAAVIIWNNEPDSGEETWTMDWDDDPIFETYEFPLTIGVQQDKGLQLLEVADSLVEAAYREDPYAQLNGTSMAAPHVAGIVALMRSLSPQTPVLQIKYVLEHTAHDIEAVGWDTNTGWGTVDALEAAQYVAPDKFGVPAPTPPTSPRRRAVR